MTRMKDVDLKHEVVDYLFEKAHSYMSFPQQFTPTKIGHDIGAYIPRIGSVAGAVVDELQARGVNITYKKAGSKRHFIIQSRRT